MDSDTLVDDLVHDGKRLAEALPEHGFDVTAAFWLKACEDGKWYFYIAAPAVEVEGLAKAYRRLHPIIRAMPQPFWIDPLEVKLIGAGNPITQDVLAIHDRTSGPRVCPIRWGGKKLGEVSIDGAYLYPLAIPSHAP